LNISLLTGILNIQLSMLNPQGSYRTSLSIDY
jgi:hypothetical protein